MGLKEDLRRFREIGEDDRMDLADFIDHQELRPRDDTISVPIKNVSLPEFEYARQQQGGIDQGDGAEQGDPMPGQAEDGDEGGDEAGDSPGEHGYYDMDPEEFAEELDEELGLDLDPKGKKVIEEMEGDFTDIARTGPDSTLDVDHLYKEGLKRTLAMSFDEEYVRELMRVSGFGPETVFEWCRNKSIAVSKAWIDDEYDDIDDPTKYDSVDDIPKTLERTPPMSAVTDVDIRREDEQYRHPEIIQKRQKNVVVVNIRDVSGSMRGREQEMVERVFAPIDWYLQGKYDHAEFIYIAHDAEAWQVSRHDFFGIQSGGGTMVSSGYELAQDVLQSYPFHEWNRFVFGAGDGGNMKMDTTDNLVPLIDDIDANMHGYIEVGNSSETHLIQSLNNDVDKDVATAVVPTKEETSDAVTEILRAASDTNIEGSNYD